jgi:hypothetical protein
MTVSKVVLKLGPVFCGDMMKSPYHQEYVLGKGRRWSRRREKSPPIHAQDKPHTTPISRGPVAH